MQVLSLKVAAIASLLVLAAGAGYAASSLSGSTGVITVSAYAPPGMGLFYAAINETQCTISSDTLSFSCPGYSLTLGNNVVVTVGVSNPASVAQSIQAPVFTFASTGNSSSSVLSITGQETYPVSVPASGSLYLHYTITGIGVGTDSAQISL